MSVKDQQLRILFSLLSKAQHTQYGKTHNFSQINTYPDFCEALPICLYDDIKPQIEEMKRGQEHILWPGAITKYAVSAGTTGQGKHLPLSAERLQSDCRFMRRVAFSYLKKWSRIPSIWGKHLSLPGSVEQQNGNQIGEISGFTALKSPWWIRPFQLQKPELLTQLPFKEKFEKVLESALNRNIKVIVGVPSWILTLFQQAIKRTGNKTVSDVWPNLQLLICGGVKLANYRLHLEKLYGRPNLDFIETYGSSEGYFAFSDNLQKNDLRLVCDNDLFYEFISDPLPKMESLSIQPTVPLWEVQPNQPYAMLVTTNAGLWRYAMNDVVTFTSVDPPRMEVKGRLNEMLDEYGEALHLYEAEEALHQAARELGLKTSAFTVGGWLKYEQELPQHYWFVQFVDPIHTQTLQKLASIIDEKLQKMNRHYAIRRESGALGTPKIRSITQQEINNWMEHSHRQQAQGKLPSLLQNKDDIAFFMRDES
ncbi:MAG: GH3 auxin-responsive promoter family protein [Balneolaceae bacterium]|nr:GH3 auxin-responsive promoter family protein [Balneolaceae bacterium]